MRLIKGLMVLLCAAVMAGNSCDKITEVETETVTPRTVEQTVASTEAGNVVARRRCQVPTRVSGLVMAIHASEGDTVEAKKVVVELDDRDAKHAVNEAKARVSELETSIGEFKIRLEAAEKDLQELRGITQSTILTAQQHRQYTLARDLAQNAKERAEKALTAAKLAVEQAERHLSHHTITASMSGIISVLTPKVGEYVVAGQTLFEIYDPASLYIEANFDEADFVFLKVGAEVRISSDSYPNVAAGPNTPVYFAGKLTRLGPRFLRPGEKTRELPCDVEFDGERPEGLRPNMSMDVEIIVSRKRGVLGVPTHTIADDDTGSFVWVIGAESKLAKRYVKLGIGNWENTELLDGAAENLVIVPPQGKLELSEGLRVKVKPPAGAKPRTLPDKNAIHGDGPK